MLFAPSQSEKAQPRGMIAFLGSAVSIAVFELGQDIISAVQQGGLCLAYAMFLDSAEDLQPLGKHIVLVNDLRGNPRTAD